MRLDAIAQSVAELLEVFRLEVFRAALRCVAAGHIDPPEIIVAQRQPGEHRLDAILQEAVDSARILRFNLESLGMRHAEERENGVAAHGESHRFGPETLADVPVVDLLLLGDGRAVEQVVDLRPQLGDTVDIQVDQHGEHAAGAAKIKRTAVFPIEKLDPAVPVSPRPLRQGGPQLVQIDPLRAGQPAAAEHGEEVFVL